MQESKSFRNKSQDFFRKQGFYIVLFFCLLIVGAAVALTLIPQAENQEAQLEPDQQAVESSLSGDEQLALFKTPAPTSTPTPVGTATPAPAQPESTPKAIVQSVKKAGAPVEGEVVFGYAMDQLLFSKTLKQWTTHPGIDIAAEAGTPVKAVLAGTVKSVTMDDALGRVVTVSHTNGRTSIYGNLEETVQVEEGKKVNAGDVIGTVGKTAVSECGEVSHLHFGFLVEDKPVDPLEHIQLPHTAKSENQA